MRHNRMWNVWGGLIPVVWGGKWGDKYLERNEMGLGLKWPPLAEATQQPTENSTSVGVVIRDTILPRQNVWGGRLPVVLDGDSSNKK